MLRKILALLFASVAIASGQPGGGPDSSRVVILSSRLGPVISRDDRDRFKLFSQIPDFRRAVVLQNRDSRFAVHFSTGKEGEKECDTVVAYPYSTLKMISEKVDNFEAILAGTYKMGDRAPTLAYADGSALTYTPATPGTPQLQESIPASWMGGFLPLAPDPGYPRLRHFPAFDIALGIRSSSPDMSGLSNVYNGDPGEQSAQLGLGVEISLSEAVGIQVEGAWTIGDQLVADGWLGVAYYFAPFEDRNLRPYIAAGAALTSIEIRKGIYTDAGGAGIGVLAGIEYIVELAVAFDLYGGYKFLPDVTGSFTEAYGSRVSIPASISLRGPVVGVRIKALQ